MKRYEPLSKQIILNEYLKIMEDHITQPLKFEDQAEMFDYQRDMVGYFIMIKTLIKDIYR